MKMKKIMAVLMTAAMVMSTGVIASADTAPATGVTTGAVTGSSTSMEGVGDIDAPVINVEMPTKFTFLIDPYKIEKAGQIVSPDLTITNKSNVNVDIRLAKMYAAYQNDFTGKEDKQPIIQTAPWTVGGEGNPMGTSKTLYLFLNKKNTALAEDGTEAEKVISAVNPKSVSVTDGTAILSGTTSMGILGKATYDKGAFKTIGEKGTLTLAMQGQANEDAVWESTDGVNVTPTFDIIPTTQEAK